MPTRDEICSTLESYVKYLSSHDVDGLVSLFAKDGVQHEPVGVNSYRGVDEIRAFDAENAKLPFTVRRNSPITVSGRYAAMQVCVQFDGMPDFLSTDLFEFDENGKIVSLSVVLDPQAQP